jgi:ribonuclease P protein component
MNGNQVPLIYSLKDKKEFSITVKSGKFTNLGIIQVRHKNIHDSDSWSLGIVCPKKIIKLSTDRNKIRRRIKHAFREFIATQKINNYGCIIIFVKAEYNKMSYQSILTNLKSLDL